MSAREDDQLPRPISCTSPSRRWPARTPAHPPARRAEIGARKGPAPSCASRDPGSTGCTWEKGRQSGGCTVALRSCASRCQSGPPRTRVETGFLEQAGRLALRFDLERGRKGKERELEIDVDHHRPGGGTFVQHANGSEGHREQGRGHGHRGQHGPRRRADDPPIAGDRAAGISGKGEGRAHGDRLRSLDHADARGLRQERALGRLHGAQPVVQAIVRQGVRQECCEFAFVHHPQERSRREFDKAVGPCGDRRQRRLPQLNLEVRTARRIQLAGHSADRLFQARVGDPKRSMTPSRGEPFAHEREIGLA